MRNLFLSLWDIIDLCILFRIFCVLRSFVRRLQWSHSRDQSFVAKKQQHKCMISFFIARRELYWSLTTVDRFKLKTPIKSDHFGSKFSCYSILFGTCLFFFFGLRGWVSCIWNKAKFAVWKTRRAQRSDRGAKEVLRERKRVAGIEGQKDTRD